MCSPTILFATSMAMTAYSGYRQAQAQREAGNAQNNYYDALQQRSQMEGQYAMRMGRVQSNLVQEQAKREGKSLAKSRAQFNASQRAKMVAQGMDVSSVTAQDIIESNYSEQELDELTLRHNADLKSWNITETAKNKNWVAQAQADQYGFAGDNAKTAGKINARNTILSTATSMAGSAATFGALGGFDGLRSSTANNPFNRVFSGSQFRSGPLQSSGLY